MNRDGLLDAVVGAWDGQGPLRPSVLYGERDGRLSAPTQPISGSPEQNWSGALAVMHADADQTIDIAMPYDNSDEAPTSWSVAVFSGADFSLLADFCFGGLNPGNPIGGLDVNRDGSLDLVYDSFTLVSSPGGRLVRRLNRSLGLPTDISQASRVLNFDSDGVSGLLLVNESEVEICLTRGRRFCAERQRIATGLSGPAERLAVKDLNHDQRKDLVLGRGAELSFLVSLADGRYEVARAATVGGSIVSNIAIGDVDGDNNNDVLVGDFSNLAIYYGQR